MGEKGLWGFSLGIFHREYLTDASRDWSSELRVKRPQHETGMDAPIKNLGEKGAGIRLNGGVTVLQD